MYEGVEVVEKLIRLRTTQICFRSTVGMSSKLTGISKTRYAQTLGNTNLLVFHSSN